MLSAAAFPPLRSFARTSASFALKTQRGKRNAPVLTQRSQRPAQRNAEQENRTKRKAKKALNRRQRRERTFSTRNLCSLRFLLFRSLPPPASPVSTHPSLPTL